MLAFRRIGAHHGSAQARQRLAQDAAAAADVEDAQPFEAVEPLAVALELPAGGVLDDSRAAPG